MCGVISMGFVSNGNDLYERYDWFVSVDHGCLEELV